MKGLQSLKVTLVDPSAQDIWETSWLELEATIMEPIKKVRLQACRDPALRDRAMCEEGFELTLPYVSCDVGRDMGGSGVRLRRPGDVVEQP